MNLQPISCWYFPRLSFHVPHTRIEPENALAASDGRSVGRAGGFRLGGLTVIEFAGEVKVYIMINDNLQRDRELLDLYNLCAEPLNY